MSITRGMARLTIPRDTVRPVRCVYTSPAVSRPNGSRTPSESPSVAGSPTARLPAFNVRYPSASFVSRLSDRVVSPAIAA